MNPRHNNGIELFKRILYHLAMLSVAFLFGLWYGGRGDNAYGGAALNDGIGRLYTAVDGTDTSITKAMEGRNGDLSNAFHPTNAVIAPSMREEHGIASTVMGGDREACERKLDELDSRYDDRRKPRQDRKRGEGTGVRLFDLYEPEAQCFDEERFGSRSKRRFDSFGDGPKFLCGVDYIASRAKETEGCLVYSVGSNNDIRFERAVRTHMIGCEVHTFDPTIMENDFVGAEYSTFHSWGIGTDGGKEGRAMGGRENIGTRKSFQTIMKDLGHENRTIDILKVRGGIQDNVHFYTVTSNIPFLFHYCHQPDIISSFSIAIFVFHRLIVKDASMPPCRHYST